MLSDAVDRGKRLLRDRLTFGITPEQEDAFRKDGLRTDIKLARIGILLIFVPILVYVFNDYQFFGTSSEFFGLVALRGGLAVCSIALLYYLDKISDYRTYDRYLTAWLIVAIVSNLLINLTRPENYVVHVIVVTVFVFIIYLILPNRFEFQIVLTATLSLGESLIIIFSTRPSITDLFPVLVSLAFVFFIAFISSWELHDQRRRAFLEIVDRSKAELALTREKDRLTSLVNSISDEVWFADPDGNFTLTNPSAAREFMLGKASDGVTVQQMASDLEVLRIDGSPRPMEEAPPLKALKGEVVKGQEEMVRTPANGELRFRQVNASPVRDAAGQIDRLGVDRPGHHREQAGREGTRDHHPVPPSGEREPFHRRAGAFGHRFLPEAVRLFGRGHTPEGKGRLSLL